MKYLDEPGRKVAEITPIEVTSTVGCKVSLLLLYLQTPGACAEAAQGWSAAELCYVHQFPNHPLPIAGRREMAEQQVQQQAGTAEHFAA